MTPKALQNLSVKEKNAFALQTRFPHLMALHQTEMAKHADSSKTFYVQEGPTGYLVLAANTSQGEYLMTSRLNPEAAAQTVVNRQMTAGYEAIILVGLGLGYLPQAMLAVMTSVQKMIILEPAHALFDLQMASVDLTRLVSDERVFWVVEDSEIRLIEKIRYLGWRIQANHLRLIVSPGYEPVFNAEIRALKKFLEAEDAWRLKQEVIFASAVRAIKEKYFEQGMMRNAEGFFKRMEKAQAETKSFEAEAAFLFFKEMATHRTYRESTIA